PRARLLPRRLDVLDRYADGLSFAFRPSPLSGRRGAALRGLLRPPHLCPVQPRGRRHLDQRRPGAPIRRPAPGRPHPTRRRRAGVEVPGTTATRVKKLSIASVPVSQCEDERRKMAIRHRTPTIFSIYMVDVLCCALGCVILLWQLYHAESEEQTAAARD